MCLKLLREAQPRQRLPRRLPSRLQRWRASQQEDAESKPALTRPRNRPGRGGLTGSLHVLLPCPHKLLPGTSDLRMKVSCQTTDRGGIEVLTAAADGVMNGNRGSSLMNAHVVITVSAHRHYSRHCDTTHAQRSHCLHMYPMNDVEFTHAFFARQRARLKNGILCSNI